MDAHQKLKTMNKEELEEYLESIGGLVNGYYSDRAPIKDAYYFSVGEGWYEIIKNLIDELIADGWNKQICQVKEKFGGLRFYTNGGGENHYEIIAKHERLSYETCEECGSPGSERNVRECLFTLCDSHYIDKVIEKFNTKNKEGFTYSEIDDLLKKFPNINKKKFDDSMMCNTCAIIEGEHIIYSCDIMFALHAGLEKQKTQE